MKVTKEYCDYCGKENKLTNKDSYDWVNIKIHDPRRDGENKLTFCPDCFDKQIKWEPPETENTDSGNWEDDEIGTTVDEVYATRIDCCRGPVMSGAVNTGGGA